MRLIECVEGPDGNGCVVKFFEDFVSTDEALSGCSVSDLWSSFEKTTSFKDRMRICKDKGTLKRMLWSYCSATNLSFNPNRTGATMSEKRWLVGPRNEQEEWVKVTA